MVMQTSKAISERCQFGLQFAVLFCCVFGASTALSSAGKWFDTSFDVMGTRASVELWAKDRFHAEQTFALVEAEMRRIDRTMSAYSKTNALAKINALEPGQFFVLSTELYQLISQSLTFSQISQGAFDISYASVGYLYDYREKIAPKDKEIADRLDKIDYRNLMLDKHRGSIQFAKPNMRIDLGGIAKGYAVDRSIEILIEKGVESALVSAGGDSRMIGDRGPVSEANDHRADQKVDESTAAIKQRIPWMIGIQHPRDKKLQALRIPLSDTAISTSGDYERYFIDRTQGEERRVHHILNPQTGSSAKGLVSTTVIGPSSVYCDALSTTLFVLGLERGLALINSIDNYEAVFIDAKGVLAYSEGLQPN